MSKILQYLISHNNLLSILIDKSKSVAGSKGQCHEIFDFWFFFNESVSPKAREYTIRAISNFSKICGDICSSRCTTGVVNHKSFNYFVWTPLGSRVNLQMHLCLQVHFKVSAAWYCSHYLPPVSLTPVANLPVLLIPVANLLPVSLTLVANLPQESTTLAKLLAKFAAGVVDTGGKFATGVVYTVVHLDLRISPWICEKIWNDPNGILWGWGGNWFMKKKQKQKISWHCPFKENVQPDKSGMKMYWISLRLKAMAQL